jgi:predicted nucleic acid-binding protein
MLFDTDVLIWCFRGNENAAKRIDMDSGQRLLSMVSYMELFQEARNSQEKMLIHSFLSDFDFTVLPLSENIGKRASIYIEEYALRHGIQMADALIAATAIENGSELCTSNYRYFKCIEDLSLKTFKP